MSIELNFLKFRILVKYSKFLVFLSLKFFNSFKIFLFKFFSEILNFFKLYLLRTNLRSLELTCEVGLPKLYIWSRLFRYSAFLLKLLHHLIKNPFLIAYINLVLFHDNLLDYQK